jgi:hypothetical protein
MIGVKHMIGIRSPTLQNSQPHFAQADRHLHRRQNSLITINTVACMLTEAGKRNSR